MPFTTSPTRKSCNSYKDSQTANLYGRGQPSPTWTTFISNLEFNFLLASIFTVLSAFNFSLPLIQPLTEARLNELSRNIGVPGKYVILLDKFLSKEEGLDEELWQQKQSPSPGADQIRISQQNSFYPAESKQQTTDAGGVFFPQPMRIEQLPANSTAINRGLWKYKASRLCTLGFKAH